MIERSIGIFETRNLSSSIKALSIISKDNAIKLIDKQILGEGIVAMVFAGNLGALKQAFRSGAEQLNSSDDFRSFHIVPMPHSNLLSLFGIKGN